MQLHILNPTSVGIQLPSNFSAAHALEFREVTRTALARAPREVFLDCAQFTYMDSTGLGLLALAQTEAAKFGCAVKLANVLNPHVRQLLGLMQYDQLFPIVALHFPSPSQKAQSLKQGNAQ